jgi:hypothetical protein
MGALGAICVYEECLACLIGVCMGESECRYGIYVL